MEKVKMTRKNENENYENIWQKKKAEKQNTSDKRKERKQNAKRLNEKKVNSKG